MDGCVLGLPNLQGVYEASAGASPSIDLVNGQPIVIQDAPTPLTSMFTLEDNAGVDKFTIGRIHTPIGTYDGWDTAISGHLAIGDSPASDDVSILVVAGQCNLQIATPQGKAAVEVDATMNMIGSIKQAAAFSGKGTVTGAAVLPFVSGMLFQVDQQGTGSWGANPTTWGQAPAIVAARVTSQAGSADLGGSVAIFKAFPPALSGGYVPSGIYAGFEACTGDPIGGEIWGSYCRAQSTTGAVAGGMRIDKTTAGTAVYGLQLNGDGLGADVCFGAGKDARIYYDGTDLVLDPNLVGTGIVLIGATGNDSMRLTNIEIDGALNHDGATAGFFNVAPVAQPADIGALTDSTGGTADGTLVAISGSGDDANINNNFADLAAKVSGLRTTLRNLGLMA